MSDDCPEETLFASPSRRAPNNDQPRLLNPLQQ